MSRVQVQSPAVLRRPDGAAKVGFLQAGSGATARTLESKLKELVTVGDFGAVRDGVTDDSAAVTACDAVGRAHLANAIVYVGSPFVFSNDPIPFSGKLIGDRIRTSRARGDLIGLSVQGDTNDFTCLDYGNDVLRRFVLNDVATPNRAYLCKPSLNNPGDVAEGYLIALNRAEGSDTTTAVAYSWDGDNGWHLVIGNLARNIQRSGGGVAAGYALAGAAGADPLPQNESRGVLWLANLAWDINGEAYHVEDVCPQTQLIGNLARGVQKGIRLINDHGPFMHNYLANAVYEHTEEGFYAAGTGSVDSINVAFNLIDGADATQTTRAMIVGQVASRNVNLLGNIIARQDGAGLEVQAGGAVTIAYGIFHDIAGAAIVGRSAAGGLGTGVLIESNNKFDTVGAVIDASAAANLIGDQERSSPLLVSNVATAAFPLFVAQRPGIITSVKLIYVSPTTSGSDNANVDVGISGDNSITTFIVSRGAAQWSVTERKPAALSAYQFNQGDVITVACDGAGDTDRAVIVQVEFFYYN